MNLLAAEKPIEAAPAVLEPVQVEPAAPGGEVEADDTRAARAPPALISKVSSVPPSFDLPSPVGEWRTLRIESHLGPLAHQYLRPSVFIFVRMAWTLA